MYCVLIVWFVCVCVVASFVYSLFVSVVSCRVYVSLLWLVVMFRFCWFVALCLDLMCVWFVSYLVCSVRLIGSCFVSFWLCRLFGSFL